MGAAHGFQESHTRHIESIDEGKGGEFILVK